MNLILAAAEQKSHSGNWGMVAIIVFAIMMLFSPTNKK